jgi:U2 small nuclear ribonucleoprotein A'
MPRLTAELILKSPSYLNPLKERELDLRGNKIAVIENLGATQDQYDCLDLSDNELTKVENFPLLNRLRTLLASNNQISRITLKGEQLPHLETLILTNNKINNLPDIDPLADFPSLRTLSLLENMVTKKQNYRLYVIHKLPKLTLLDFRKIKQKERQASEKLFGAPDKAKPKEVSTDKMESAPQTPSGYTNQQVEAIKAAIKSASSMEEVAELERLLASGSLPLPAHITNKMET